MTNSNSVSPSLAALDARGWNVLDRRSAPLPTQFPRLVVQTGDSFQSRGAYNVTASAVVAQSDLVTITAANHGQFAGGLATLSGANESCFEGIFPVLKIISTSQFQVRCPGSGNLTATGTTQVINNHSARDLNALEMANAMLGHPFTVLRNAGKPGKKIEDVWRGIFRDVLALGPHAVDLSAGINNVQACAAGQEAAELVVMKTYFSRIVDACVGKGAQLWAHTISPLGAAHGSYSTARVELLLEFNAWLAREYSAFADPGIILINDFSVCVDPLSAIGAWKAGYSSDDIHGNATARQKVAILQSTVIAKNYFSQSPKISSIADNYGVNAANPNVIVNPLFTVAGGSLGTAGAGAGVATNTSHPAQWTGTWTRAGAGTVTSQLVPRADGLGNNIRYTCNPADAGDQISILSNAMAARVSLGDILAAGCNFSISSIAAVSNVFFCIDWSDADGTYTQPCAMITGSDGQLTTDFNWWLRTLPFKLITTPLTFRVRATVAFSGAAAGVVVEIGCVDLDKHPGLAADDI